MNSNNYNCKLSCTKEQSVSCVIMKAFIYGVPENITTEEKRTMLNGVTVEDAANAIANLPDGWFEAHPDIRDSILAATQEKVNGQ